MVKPTINSDKHVVQFSLGSISAGAVSTHVLIDAVAAHANPDEVRIGSSVKAIYCEMWFRGGDTGSGSTYVAIICKHNDVSGSPSTTDMGTLHDYTNKKNVLYTSQGLINDDASIATPVLKFWLKIPKGKQRFGLGDSLKLHVFAQTGITDRCGLFIFKEYY